MRWVRWVGGLDEFCVFEFLNTDISKGRPPSLMVLNEPETSLHPELLPALGRLMKRCAQSTQLWVTTHAESLIDALTHDDDCNHPELAKELGETSALGFRPLDLPPWRWPGR